MFGYHVGINGHLIYLLLDTTYHTIKTTKTSGYRSAVHKEDMTMKEKNYSETIANVIKSYLKEDDWNFSFDEERGLFKFGLSLRNKIKNISYIIDVRDDAYIVYAISPICADEEDKKMMDEISVFLCRVNYEIPYGNFESDMTDGEVRYRYFVDCDGIIPTTAMVKNSIQRPAGMFKYYGSGIVDIIFRNATAKEAIEKCEKEAEAEIRSLLSKLMEGECESELGEMLAKLAERLGSSKDDDESSDTVCVPAMIKTDLFGTEGDDN